MSITIRILFTNFIFIISFVLLIYNVAIASSEAEILYNQGVLHLESQKYNKAIEQFENAIELEPDNAVYQHLLAVSYGREAEQASWFRAVDLAHKTRIHLEIASDLAPDNIDILEDLMDFYREAPGFLGGGDDKADKIESLIKKINTKELDSAKIE